MIHDAVIQAYQDLEIQPLWGEDGGSVFTVSLGSESAGELVVYQIKAKSGVVDDTRFQVHGCGYMIAVCVWLSRWLQGRALADCATFSYQNAIQALHLPKHKYHCAMLAEDIAKQLSAVH